MKKSLLIFIALISSSISFSQSCVDILDAEYEACFGDSLTLDATCTNALSFQWLKDGVVINGETTATLETTESGVYQVDVTTSSGVVSSNTTVTFINILASQPSPIELCDLDSDGFENFDLTIRESEITGGQNDLFLSYHSTLADANASIFAIPNPNDYVNTVAFSEIIYVRVASSAVSNCFTVVELELIINNLPNITSPSDYIIEETPFDGLAIFDLTTKDVEILNGLSSADHQVKYFVTEADAVADINPIVDFTNYQNTTNPETIFANTTNVVTGCVGNVVNFDLVVIDMIDFDNDGIPNEDEDLNNNGNLEDDDTDGDGIPNYLDSDDDGDNVETIDETQGIGAGLAPQIFIDTDNDLIENYLDNDDDGDGVLTKDEDYNGNGDPIDDDTNNNNIPDFLDADVALGVTSQDLVGLKMYPNPAKNVLQLSIPTLEIDAVITIYSIQGKLLSSEILNGGATAKNINIAGLQSGVYFLKVENENGSLTKKFVKE